MLKKILDDKVPYGNGVTYREATPAVFRSSIQRMLNQQKSITQAIARNEEMLRVCTIFGLERLGDIEERFPEIFGRP